MAGAIFLLRSVIFIILNAVFIGMKHFFVDILPLPIFLKRFLFESVFSPILHRFLQKNAEVVVKSLENDELKEEMFSKMAFFTKNTHEIATIVQFLDENDVKNRRIRAKIHNIGEDFNKGLEEKTIYSNDICCFLTIESLLVHARRIAHEN